MVSAPANHTPIRVVTESFPGRPIFDTAVTSLLRLLFISSDHVLHIPKV